MHYCYAVIKILQDDLRVQMLIRCKDPFITDPLIH